MRAAYPHLCKTRGCVINFGSGAAFDALPTQGAYAAAKEAIRAISKVAANEWGPDGVRVNIKRSTQAAIVASTRSLREQRLATRRDDFIGCRLTFGGIEFGNGYRCAFAREAASYGAPYPVARARDHGPRPASMALVFISFTSCCQR